MSKGERRLVPDEFVLWDPEGYAMWAEKVGAEPEWAAELAWQEGVARSELVALGQQWEAEGESRKVARLRCPKGAGCLLGWVWASSVGFALAAKLNRSRLIVGPPGEAQRKFRLRAGEAGNATGVGWDVVLLRHAAEGSDLSNATWRCEHLNLDSREWRSVAQLISSRYSGDDAVVPRRSASGIIDAAGGIRWTA